MKVWLHKQGPGFKWPLAKDARPLHFLPNATKNEDQPFPLNPEFRSQPVLSESAREDIWRRVVEKRESIKAVSVALNIDQRRVAAVVRMKEVEKRWVAEVCNVFTRPFTPVPVPIICPLRRGHLTRTVDDDVQID